MIKPLAPLAAATAFAALATPAVAQAYRTGQTVLASPGQIDATWTRCVIVDRMAGVMVSGTKTPDNYKMNCVNAYTDHHGRKVQSVQEAWVKETWMKPNNTGFRSDWQLPGAQAQDAAYRARAAQVAAQLAKPTTRPAPAGAGGGSPRAGSYECWANGYARMNMNFRVTGPGTYRNDSGSGRFSVGPGGKLTLTGPMLESMPDGFIAVYHTPGGKPTVSFRSPRGAEAAFCEHAG